MKDNVIVLGLNEINFDYIKYYIQQGHLPALKQLLDENKLVETTSEQKYQLLEPWIQWVTIQTGKTYKEHQVFRLGDITERKDLKQIFEKIEEKGRTIGVISPFNADNRLTKSEFFVPDPWTDTPATGSFLVRKLSEAVSQTVNDNAQSKFSISSLISILLSLLVYVPFSRYGHYLNLVANRKKAGAKAIILDSLLSDIFVRLLKRKQPEFSWLFLNSGAHIQHHYLFNSGAYTGELQNPEWYCEKGYDPLLRVLEEYDITIGRLLKQDSKLLIMTGLHQQPHRHMTFYWRLKEHASFLNEIGIHNYTNLLPRMSRDFLAEFANEEDAKAAEERLASYFAIDGQTRIFTIDNRGTSLFVELTYPKDIDEDFSITNAAGETVSNFKQYIAFVAIKNGEHNGIGYLLANFELETPKQIELKEVHDLLLELA